MSESNKPRTLWDAAKDDDVEQIAFLLKEGAPIDECDTHGCSPLMFAAYHGKQTAFDFLLLRGADPSIPDLMGNTVLMGAAFKGHAAMVRTLLKLGVDVLARNDGGLDAAGFAAMFGRAEVAALLAPYHLIQPEGQAH